jgi:hypothetical protein
MADVNELKVMWEEWQSIPFPSDYSGKDVEGICVTSLDTYAAGCVHTFIFHRSSFDPWRLSVLEKCKGELEIVLKKLDGGAKDYFGKLLELSEKVLSSVGSRPLRGQHNNSFNRTRN